MTDILVRPPELRQTAEHLRASADKIGRALQSIDATLSTLRGTSFLGNRANAVQVHYRSGYDALMSAKELVIHFARDLDAAANVFENADKAGIQPESGNNIAGSTFPKWTETMLNWAGDGIDLSRDLTLLAVLRNGQTFPEQVKIFGPRWYSKHILELPENLRSIKASHLVDDLASGSLEVTPLNTAFAFFQLATDVIPDWFKYTDTAHRGAAVATDSLIVAASIGAGYYGMQGGALIGSAICPGVGTVVGGLAGGFLAGWAADHVLTTPFSDLIPEAGALVGGVVGNTYLPGFGIIAGGRLGGDVGRMITGLISPEITQVSVKDIAINGLADFIQGTGDAIGDLLYPPPQPQGGW